MPSLIPSYEYDIFISYRHKDNKGDKWVSGFVDALKTELEATFKEDVSVYFDENPHDRLQETHNVDKSLENKLKCLIFIPILSQTYCDPNSYAWKYEFLTFLKMAGSDRYGLDIRLRNGNVASRILPVRIHDLEPEDVNLFENETGSVMRAMDFVFKTSTGVIRPLLQFEDHTSDNLNKTFYRDQISKVALAIKEIILGLKTEPEKVIEEKVKEVRSEKNIIIAKNPSKSVKFKVILIVAIAAVLVIIAIFVYANSFSRNSIEKLRSSGERISVAVLPFRNMTNDTSWNYMQYVVQENLTNFLLNFSDDLKVRQTLSINTLIQNKNIIDNSLITGSVASSISQKLDASVYIYGTINKAGLILRINAQLVDSKTEEILKSFKIEGLFKEDIIFHIIDSLSLMLKNYLILSKLEDESAKAGVVDIFGKGSTNSPEAYKYYIYGNLAFQKERDYTTARNWYLQAISLDSSFTSAENMIIGTYYNQGLYDQAKKWCLKAFDKRNLMPIQQQLLINDVHSALFETPNEGIKYLKRNLDNDDQQPIIWYLLGYRYMGLNQYENAIPNLEKSFEIYKKWGSDPYWVYNYTLLGYAYHKTGKYKAEKSLYNKAEHVFPDDPDLIYRQAVLALAEGDTIGDNQYIKKYETYLRGKSVSEAAIATGKAGIYSDAGVLYKAEKYYRQALSLEPGKSRRLRNLAYFLIDNERNITEGLNLADRALEAEPDSYGGLYVKGCGLYKQGKYLEAKDILQKSWDLRREQAVYNHEAFLYLEAAKKAVANLNTVR